MKLRIKAGLMLLGEPMLSWILLFYFGRTFIGLLLYIASLIYSGIQPIAPQNVQQGLAQIFSASVITLRVLDFVELFLFPILGLYLIFANGNSNDHSSYYSAF